MLLRQVICAIAALLIQLQFITEASASGLIGRFPKDGVWVRYTMTMKNPDAPGDTLVGKLTVRFVGKLAKRKELFDGWKLKSAGTGVRDHWSITAF